MGPQRLQMHCLSRPASSFICSKSLTLLLLLHEMAWFSTNSNIVTEPGDVLIVENKSVETLSFVLEDCTPPLTLRIVETLTKTICGQICLGMLDEQLIVVKLGKVKNFAPDEPRWTCEDCVQESHILRTIPPHPHLVEYIFDFKVLDSSWKDKSEIQVLLLENLPGGDLFDYLDQHGRLSEFEARRIFLQLFAGLRHIHENGFCHLDLSLENILLSEDFQIAKICDFGQALGIEVLKKERQHKFRRGKKMYMAPEIASFGENICGTSCDLYSLGIVLFCMLTGMQPYKEPDWSDLGFSLIINGELELLFEYLQVPCCICMEGRVGENADTGCLHPTEHLISPMALDLLSGMICYRENRWSVQQIENHPWLTEDQSM